MRNEYQSICDERPSGEVQKIGICGLVPSRSTPGALDATGYFSLGVIYLMNLKEQLLALQKAMQAIVDGAKALGRDLNDSEVASIEAKAAEATDLKAKIERQAKGDALIASLTAASAIGEEDPNDPNGYTSAKNGYLALTGQGGKKAASVFARALGQKAFLTPGTQVFATPMESQSPLELQRIPTSILDVLKSTVRSAPAWKYLRQTAFTNNAAIVAAGAEKPTSVITLGEEEGLLEVIAHLTEPVNKYLLEDNDTLVAFIATQMLYGIGRTLESEVLSGNGTTGHFTGLLNTAGIQTQAAGPDKVTTLRMAATKLEVLGYTPDVYIVNPNDWAEIETTRATSGSFDLGGPIDRAQRKVWGTQVITSTGITAGTALTLDLDAATVDRDERGIQVEWDRSQGFKTNEIIGRVEGRFGLSVYRPDAIVKITLPTTP
ncbi:HK97 family phage major capsid protein [Microbacterium resistens]|uniref:HK97 family phage major capsid protein n=1 Tax=Microbacterium resistens TaxID=156977 RepID=A0ABU1SEW0_9MICO|nr:phage major capsid protein [Microbacterium resistens]MDR6868153.1 HK97 family phage major capsid protein [Microbacterium resistens]